MGKHITTLEEGIIALFPSDVSVKIDIPLKVSVGEIMKSRIRIDVENEEIEYWELMFDFSYIMVAFFQNPFVDTPSGIIEITLPVNMSIVNENGRPVKLSHYDEKRELLPFIFDFDIFINSSSLLDSSFEIWFLPYVFYTDDEKPRHFMEKFYVE